LHQVWHKNGQQKFGSLKSIYLRESEKKKIIHNVTRGYLKRAQNESGRDSKLLRGRNESTHKIYLIYKYGNRIKLEKCSRAALHKAVYFILFSTILRRLTMSILHWPLFPKKYKFPPLLSNRFYLKYNLIQKYSVTQIPLNFQEKLVKNVVFWVLTVV
jgi:hypothetical protein